MDAANSAAPSVRPEDALAIHGAIAALHRFIDLGRASEGAALFAADARLTFGPGSPKPGTIEGADAIRNFLTARQAQAHVTTRHVVTNIVLTLLTDGRIAASSIMTLFRSESDRCIPDVAFVADLEEIYSRAPAGRWLISERRVTPAFARD